MPALELDNTRIGIIGLGYVGLPLAIDLIQELRDYGARVDVHDPWADPQEALEEYGLDLIQPQAGHYRAIVLAVAHQQFKDQGAAQLRAYGQPGAVLYDVKHVFLAAEVDGRL